MVSGVDEGKEAQRDTTTQPYGTERATTIPESEIIFLTQKRHTQKSLLLCNSAGLLQNRFRASGPKQKKMEWCQIPILAIFSLFSWGRASGGRNYIFNFFLFRAGGPKLIL